LRQVLWIKERGQRIHPLYSIYNYNENTGNTEGQTTFRVYEKHVSLHLIFVYFLQYDDLFMINPVQSLHQMSRPMKTALHIEDLVTSFVTITKIDSNFLNFICIVRVIHLLCPGESDKADGFSFFMF